MPTAVIKLSDIYTICINTPLAHQVPADENQILPQTMQVQCSATIPYHRISKTYLEDIHAVVDTSYGRIKECALPTIFMEVTRFQLAV